MVLAATALPVMNLKKLLSALVLTLKRICRLPTVAVVVNVTKILKTSLRTLIGLVKEAPAAVISERLLEPNV